MAKDNLTKRHSLYIYLSPTDLITTVRKLSFENERETNLTRVATASIAGLVYVGHIFVE